MFASSARTRTMRLATLALLATAPAAAQEMFHANSAHTGVYAAPGPRQLGGVKWTFKGGGPIVTSRAIAEGVVYIGAMDGHLYAITRTARRSGTSNRKCRSRHPPRSQ